MTLAAFMNAVPPVAEYAAHLWQLIAFLGRYGHQPLSEVLYLPKSELLSLRRALVDLLEQEKDSTGERVAHGGG